MGYVWNMYGIFMEYGCICMKYLWNMCDLYGICLEYVLNMYGICVEHVRHMHGISMELCGRYCNMHGVFAEYRWNI